jgi:hypothetical protein
MSTYEFEVVAIGGGPRGERARLCLDESSRDSSSGHFKAPHYGDPVLQDYFRPGLGR